MPQYTVLYDDLQEARWFCNLNGDLLGSRAVPITVAQSWPSTRRVLAYDRPDIVLLDGDTPILVVEETVEVPSGHNPGQRFARIAAAAEAGVPVVYFFPYVAKKHGGETAGRRFVNARLFKALDALTEVTGTIVTAINWPVNEDYEVLRGESKDADVREYVKTFLELNADQPDADQPDMGRLNDGLSQSAIHSRMAQERDHFVRSSIRKPSQYDSPPETVRILTPAEFRQRHGQIDDELLSYAELVVYKIGSKDKGLRSDPYTGCSLMYRYLYVQREPKRALVLWFPEISVSMWQRAVARGRGKSVRLYSVAADAILFSDELVLRKNLQTVDIKSDGGTTYSLF